MFEAVLNNKLNIIENKEDFITSCVFGALKYDYSNELIKSFLSKAKTVNGKKWELDDFNNVSYYFWPRFNSKNSSSEPDLILKFSKNEESFYVIIEIKNFSKKSGSGEFDQLKKYYLIRNRLNELENIDLNDFNVDQVKALVYLTRGNSNNEIKESISELGKEYSSKCPILSLMWSELISVCKTNKKLVNNDQVVNDIISFLNYSNIKEFAGFDSIRKMDFNVENDVFYNHKYFDNINISNYNSSGVIFYER